MDCKRFKSTLIETDPHVIECAECRAELGRLERLTSDLDEMLSLEPSPRFAGIVRSRVESRVPRMVFMRWAAVPAALVLAATSAILMRHTEPRAGLPNVTAIGMVKESEVAVAPPVMSRSRTRRSSQPRADAVLVPPGQLEAILLFQARLLRNETSTLIETPFDPESNLSEPPSIEIQDLEIAALDIP